MPGSTSKQSSLGSTSSAVIARVDLDGVLDRIDPDRLLDRVDPNRLLDRVDPDRLLDRVDPDRLLDRVDPDRLLDRVDPDRLLDRVDPDRLVARVDFDAVVERVDVNAVMERVDVNSLVSRTELGEVIARSTTGVFGQLLDAARIAVMALDLTLHGLAARVLRRDDPTAQFGPEQLDDKTQMWQLPPQDRAVALQGRYAGAVSRFLAFLLDVTLTGALFGLIGTLLVSALQIVANVTWEAADHRLLVSVAYVVWQFMYFAGTHRDRRANHRQGGARCVGRSAGRNAGDAPCSRDAHARVPAELPAVRCGLLRGCDPPGPSRTPRSDRRDGRRVRVGCRDRPSAIGFVRRRRGLDVTPRLRPGHPHRLIRC